MPTFLVTSRMAPELAARVEKAVTGRPAAARGKVTPRVIALLRLVLVATAIFGGYTLLSGRRKVQQAFVHDRNALLARIDAEAASLTPQELDAVPRASGWLGRLAGPYEGDYVADELKKPGALEATLAAPTVYVRGPLADLTTSAKLAEAAATSVKDGLVVCLLSPPATRNEKEMLEKVRIAFGGGAKLEQATPNVHRLHDAMIGLPFLLPSWSNQVRAASDAEEVARLRVAFERAPIARAKGAAKSELLLAVHDEPGDGQGVTELDGERPHDIRLAIVDVKRSVVLLRQRKHVDPSFISVAKRPTYAAALDGCGVAYDVRKALP